MNHPNHKPLIENDDYPIFQLVVEEVGEQTAQIFTVLRQVMQLSPAQAKVLLQARQFEVARGPLMIMEDIEQKLKRAGAKTQLIAIETD